LWSFQVNSFNVFLSRCSRNSFSALYRDRESSLV
jgi:hypothetical protein